MSQIAYTEHERYLEARLWTTDSTDRIKEQIAELLKACIERKTRKVLVDFSGFVGTWSLIDRYELGTAGARFAPHVSRVAVFSKADLIDREKFGVRVAQNRGLNIEIFDDREKAVLWLLETD